MRLRPSWPYCITIVSLFCVMRLTGPSNAQSNVMLVVWQLKRGLSSRLNSAAAFSPSGVSSVPP